ncbi:uncharacterized protein ACLA_095770 [Aspergillus clavatus NRRL 1]|uniref:Sld7 C-terminal domain-containing protein n=1 Tax=Aspergillus clavatus (strain ATCC 1007 / CBS 513.65 / DSM 816 / NCTC 3887 / NRRL 1 / QM 1276 / 107) TaxID=344612 RepID=A1CM57_ASPCL|nr:uncharacterized protein ACLA_095770 [Aspergillus clavatus NRRL 1]EAW08644.1 conserved hypothetical protein [Aspergillus clavatus NRRL 1]
MDIWTGAIELNRDTQLRGLRLIDRTAQWHSDILKDSTLTLRCFVNPALVPIYARTGPNLELHTADIETAQWLKSKLLGNIWLEEEELENFQTFQCPVGILLSANSSCGTKSGSLTTDLLVYGVLSSAASFERPPTPPGSSSPDPYGHDHHANKQELRIYATPLSTSLINKAQALCSPPETDTLANDARFAELLPDIRSPSPKRKRVATLFETAAQHHKKVRQKGGEAVSQLMANSLSHSSQHLQTLRIKRESEEPGLPLLERIASQRSRSLSVGAGLHSFKPSERRTEQLRPSSQRGYVRESASRKGTPNPFSEPPSRWEPTPALPASDDKPETSFTSKDSETIISENKNTIARTILTCMRLYGFNRSSKPASTSKIVDSASQYVNLATDMGPTSSTDEDEFKAMYHATYRASTFALRKYLKEPPESAECLAGPTPSLDKEKAMTYIDEFLRLFCEER